MKKLIAIAAALTFTAGINLSAQADQYGSATQAGPLVQCTHTDGKKTYVPTMICKKQGGTFVRNWGNQF